MKNLEAHDEKVGGDATCEDTTLPLEKPSPFLRTTYKSQVFKIFSDRSVRAKTQALN
jgi:hypothetical protein